MSILGSVAKGNVNDRDTGNVLTSIQVKEIQRVLLMLLKDVDKICRDNNLEYILIGGTAIGCVRHGGFIPWDDDVDVAMTRKDYEKFRKIVCKQYADKYRLTDAIRENNFGKNIPKLRLLDTVYKTLLKVDAEDQEITADIFIIENVEDNVIGKYLHGFLCLAMGYLLSCRRLAAKEEVFSKVYKDNDFKRRVFIGKILSFASLDKWAHWNENIYSICKNHNSANVSVPTDRCHFLGEIFPRSVMCDTIDFRFEDRQFRIPKAYDQYLKKRYGNYMQVPPPEKQVLSKYSKLDFGPYKDVAMGRCAKYK